MSVAIVDIWQWGLFFTVIMLKLLETLPKDPIEAAQLDHAKTWEIHAYVTLPMLKAPDHQFGAGQGRGIAALLRSDLCDDGRRTGKRRTETLDLYAIRPV